MRTRRPILALLGLAAATAAALPIAATSAPGDLLPDLRADAPENARLEPYPDGRLLLRFDGFVTNVGAGPLDITGNPSAGTMAQRVLNNGQFREVGRPEVRYESIDTHNHWHLMRAMRYSLRTADGAAEVAPAQKVGFCLYDLDAVDDAPVQAPPTYDGDGTFCDRLDPGSTSLNMGVSAGWRDVYDSRLALQWVDVSSTAPGNYQLAAEADPNNVVVEADESNGVATVPYTLPGHVAQAVNLPQTGAAQAVTLSSAQFGAPGPRRFRIVTPPANGSLSVAPGTDFAGPALTYTPNPGFRGADAFTYVTRDANSAYPLAPAAATVSLAGAAITVGITGAPATIVAGTSVQLGAAVANSSRGATWTVNGRVAGDGIVGTVTPTGLYSAPPVVPAGGAVVVRATSVENPAAGAEARIGILPRPRAKPAPGIARARLSRVRVLGRDGRTLTVRVSTSRAGRLGVSAVRRGKVVGRCRVVRVAAGRRHTCRLRMRADFAPRGVRIVAVLRPAAGPRVTRAAALRLPPR